MNDVIEKISKTITETGKVVSEKTKFVGESAKLNGKIISKENSVRSNYSVIGEFYYNKYKDNPDADIAETVNEVTEALNSIDEMKAQLLSLKGAVKCTECGAECPLDNSFCGQCGAKLVKPEPPQEEEPAEEAETAEAPPEVLEGEIIDTEKTDE
ncbi:MAG: zinc-ribbon domain-containing protein [Oscillospiraceae bacterium]